MALGVSLATALLESSGALRMPTLGVGMAPGGNLFLDCRTHDEALCCYCMLAFEGKHGTPAFSRCGTA